MQETMRRGFDPWVGKIPRRRAWQPTRIFALRITWTEEPGGLQPVRLQRVGDNWGDLACLQAFACICLCFCHHNSLVPVGCSTPPFFFNGKGRLALLWPFITLSLNYLYSLENPFSFSPMNYSILKVVSESLNSNAVQTTGVPNKLFILGLPIPSAHVC